GPPGHRAGAHRRQHADLLVGAGAHPDLLGHAPVAAGGRHRHAAPPRAAGGEPRALRRRRAGAADALGHAGGPRPGLRAHRAGQGTAGAAGGDQARAQERAHPRDDGARRSVRSPAGWRHPHRDGVLVAGHGPLSDRRDRPARLSGHPGRDPRLRRGGGDHQFAGGCVLWRAGSAGAARVKASPALRRLARHGGARFGAVVVVVFAAVAILAPWVAPYDPEAIALNRNLAAPSWGHPFGTDSLGRDVLSRTIWGARISLTIGFVSVGLAMVGGIPLGALSAWAGGWTDRLLMRSADVLISFPTLLLAIVVITIFGPGLGH